MKPRNLAKCWFNRKTLFFMKNLILIMLVSTLNIYASSSYAQQTKLSIELESSELKDVLREIRQQTDFTVLYRSSDVKEVVGISKSFEDATVMEILDACLKGTELGYEIKDKVIVIHPVEYEEPSIPVSVEQEKKIIKGVVIDSEGNTLPGVSVVIKGTISGVSTDIDGKYSIEIPAEGSVLVFSFVGMQKKEVTCSGQKEINITLESDLNEMDEVVVTGIITRKKESFTGAITTVRGDDLKKIGNSNVLESLKSIDPSFIMMENNLLGSDPNVMPEIEVRGQTSISTSDLRDEFDVNPNQPLFILDGFETSLRTIIDLDMNRVESITILKDASSTALYGAKASNGVIVVETKRALAGDMRVVYTADMQVSMPDLTTYNLMNSSEKLEFERRSGLWSANGASDQYELDKQYNATLAEISRGVDTYWLNEPVQVGITQGHSLYANGGTREFTYGVGLNYKDNQGVMIGSSRKTWGANIDLAYRKGKVNISNKLYINGYEADESKHGSFSNYAAANPYFRKRDANGHINKYLDIDDYFKENRRSDWRPLMNPLWDANLNSFDTRDNLDLINNLQAIITISPDFRFQTALQVKTSKYNRDTYLDPEHSSFISEETLRKRGSFHNTKSTDFSYKLNVMATYAKVFKEKHSFTSNVRAEAEELNSERINFSAVGFPEGTDGDPAFAFGYAENGKPSSFTSTKRRVNFLASLAYDYEKTYLFDATYRLDGSTTFGSNERFSPFWAVGAGLNVNKLLDMDETKVSIFKLRANIGSTGNQAFSESASQAIYSYSTYSNFFGQSIDLASLANPDLKWQRTLSTSLGLDLTLFSNRVNLSFNAYQNKTDDLVVSIDQASSTGVMAYPTNAGVMNTKGLEAIVRVSPINNIQERIIWTIGFTAAMVESEYSGFAKKLESLNKDARENNSLKRYFDGASPNDIWAVPSLGIDPGNGKEVFLTKEGKPTYEYHSSDERVVGNTRPTVEGVISSNLRIKNFSFGLNMRYRFGGDALNKALYDKIEGLSAADRIFNQDARALTDRWQSAGDLAQFKAIGSYASTPISSRFVQKENLILGESISIGYELEGKDWMNKVGLSRLRLNAYMNDIFRTSSIKTERGIDYPFARTVSFSLNASF